MCTRKLTEFKDLENLTKYEHFYLIWFVQNFILNKSSIGTMKKIICKFLDFIILLDLLVRFILTNILKLIFRLKEVDIIITDQHIQWKIVLDLDGTYKVSDAFFHYVVKKLESDGFKVGGVYPIITYLSTHQIISNLKIAIQKKKWNVSHIPFEMFWSVDAWIKKIRCYRYFKKVLKEDLKEFSNKIPDVDKSVIKYVFLVIFPQIVENIEVSKRFLSLVKPKVVVLLNEHDMFERSLIAACKLAKIPTIAIQHGVIHPKHPAYIYPKYAKGKVILPDITCVYGKYYYRLLTKDSIYPPRGVVITGQPRYDILAKLPSIYTKKQLLKKYGIEENKKIVLWATQTHGLSYDENVLNLETVLKTAKDLEGKNIVFIIKQHPGEAEEHTELILRFIKKYNCKNVLLVPKHSNTFELLYISDVVIVRHSTVGMEAVAMGKPLIVLNLSGEPDLVDYVEKGVAIGVYNPKDLKNAIVKLLEDDSELARNRERYIEEYLFRIDGRASERVFKVVKECMNYGNGKNN